jgi:hypothetical protein
MRSAIIQFILFFVYVLVQAMLLKNLVLFNTSFCFLYVAFILLLPVEFSKVVIILIGFTVGFSVDLFYNSMGIHACASVLIGFIRNYWLSAITPQGGYEAGSSPSVANHGVQWFLVYATPLIFIHHFVLFFAEATGFEMFWFTMLKIVSSLLFTLFVIVLLQFMVPQRKRL